MGIRFVANFERETMIVDLSYRMVIRENEAGNAWEWLVWDNEAELKIPDAKGSAPNERVARLECRKAIARRLREKAEAIEYISWQLEAELDDPLEWKRADLVPQLETELYPTR